MNKPIFALTALLLAIQVAASPASGASAREAQMSHNAQARIARPERIGSLSPDEERRAARARERAASASTGPTSTNASGDPTAGVDPAR
jgi:hypothetical protein